MKRLRLLVLTLALLVVAAVALLAGPLRDRWQDPLRALIARELGVVLGTPCALDELSISLLPLRVEVRGLRLGAAGAVASLASARIELQPQTSLRQVRPVFDVDAEQVTLDLPALLHALPPPPPGPTTRVPRFRLRRVRVRDVRVQLTEAAQPLTVSAPAVEGSLTADGILGRLRFAAHVEPVTIAHGTRTVTLERVEARGGETNVGWQLRHAVVRGDGIRLNGAERGGALHLEADVDLARLVVIDEQLDTLRGAAHVDGELTGPLDEPLLKGTVAVPALSMAERALGEITATARLDRTQVEVSAARLHALGGDADVSGSVRFDPPSTTAARVRWQNLALRELVGTAAGDDVPAAALDGEAEASGTLDPLVVSLTGSGRVSAHGGAPPVQWQGSGRYADRGGSSVIELTQGNGNVANADVSLAADGALAGTVRLRVADPDALAGLAAIESLPELRGALEANATLAGTLREPQLQGGIDGRGLMVVGVRVDSISGTFAADRVQVRSDGIRAALGGGTLTARGGVALDRVGANSWTITAGGIDGGALATLIRGVSGATAPIAGGTFSLDAAASGPWPRVRMTGTARLDDFWLGRERIAQLAADVQAADGGWTVDAHMHNRTRQEIALRASGRGDQDLVVALACDAWTLTALWQGEEAEMGGTLRATAALRGPARALSGTASVSADDLVLGGRAFGTVRVDVIADRGRWRATTNLLDDALRLAAEVRPDAGLPFTVDGSWSDADVARLLGQSHGLQLLTSGTLRANGRLDAIDQLEARADITRLDILGGAKPGAADVPVSIVCRRGVCVLDRLTLRGGTTSLRVSGEAGFDGRVRLVLAGGGSLGLLELVGEPIESARGNFTVDATVVHGGAGWSVVGTLGLAQVGLDAGLPVAITRTNGRLTFDGNIARIESLSGRVGSGTFTVGGLVDLSRGPELTWTLEDVGADPLPSLEVELGGRGALDGTWSHLRLGGDLRVNRLLYDRNIELTDFLPRLNRALAAAPRQERGTEIELALNVTAPGELYVENNLTRLEARARLALSGSAVHPAIEGRVEALDGEIFLRGRTFDLLSATLDFRPDLGMAAALNISAESLIDTPDGSYVVGVRVTGTTAEPRVVLTSDDPSLSQTDIATLIAFGRTAAQMRQHGGGNFSLSGALGSQVGDLLSGQAEKVLPIDRIDFQPTFSTTTGAFEPQLTLGKDITQDLTASVGQTFGVAARTRVEANYRLGPNVWAFGSWESQTQTEAGAFAGGLRTRYEFWRLTPFTLLGGLQ